MFPTAWMQAAPPTTGAPSREACSGHVGGLFREDVVALGRERACRIWQVLRYVLLDEQLCDDSPARWGPSSLMRACPDRRLLEAAAGAPMVGWPPSPGRTVSIITG